MPKFLNASLLERCGVINVYPSIKEAESRDVSALVYDSRETIEGALFFAYPGVHADGHDYIEAALKKGAAVIVHEKELEHYEPSAVYVRVKDARFAMSPAAAAFYGEPSRRLKIIGVTGTEGKSTTVYIIFQLLRAAGKKAGFISTVQYSVDGIEQWNKEHQTTPEAIVIHRRLSEMADNTCEFAVIEASSHGLSPRTNRLGDVRFDAGIMTCVTHEHIEFHKTWENYRDDKANLFRKAEQFCIVNADDPSAEYFKKAAKTPVLSFSVQQTGGHDADVYVKNIESRDNGNSYVLCIKQAGHPKGQCDILIEDKLPGAFNAGNVAAALLAVSRMTGMTIEELAPFVEMLKPVRGRMTRIDMGQDFELFVDYAHTPSSFETVLPPLKARLKGSGRLIVLFGSAGERDTQKRPLQGKIAAKYADIIILSDEDPRGEEPMAILREIAAGVEAERKNMSENSSLFLIPNRHKAIKKALSLARPNDIVLLLGKGHENSIIYKDRTEKYDEISAAEEALRLVIS